ncbi:tRNA-splicing ligase [Hyaloraphidium curvatum]|nr:tRNA-splicing ligase [Hyaloraphidium curvatum]
MLRLTLVNNARQTERCVVLLKNAGSGVSLADVKDSAKKKLRVKATRLFNKEGRELQADGDLASLQNDAVVLVSAGEDFVGRRAVPVEDAVPPTVATVTLVAKHSFVHEQAVAQLNQTSLLPGVVLAAGMPDLHPGNTHPIGASFASRGMIYAGLVGSDIGCGMLLRTTSLPATSDPHRIAQKLHLEGPYGSAEQRMRWMSDAGVEATGFEESLGTIGAGNHFAELQAVERVLDEECVRESGIDGGKLLLLVHSGSRGFGQSILDRHAAQHGSAGLEVGTADADAYLAGHEKAIRWARVNRALIAHRIESALGIQGSSTSLDSSRNVLDVWHNLVEPKEVAVSGVEALPETLWIHRKGAAPADRGLVVIPGSRGTFSFLVQPIDGPAAVPSCYSLAHGAGRLLTRHKALEKLGDLARKKGLDLEQTSLGSVVVCSDKTLLYEEAPEAYKDSDAVVKDLEEAGLCRVVAVLRPVVTYKVR